MYLFSSIWIALVCFIAFKIVAKYFATNSIHWLKSLWYCFGFSFIINLLMLSNSEFMVLLYIAASPLLLGVLAQRHFNIMGANSNETLKYLLSNYFRLLGTLLLFLLISFLAFIFILSSFSFLVIYFMEINVAMAQQTYTLVLKSLLFFGFAFVLSFCIVFYIFFNDALHRLKIM